MSDYAPPGTPGSAMIRGHLLPLAGYAGLDAAVSSLSSYSGAFSR